MLKRRVYIDVLRRQTMYSADLPKPTYTIILFMSAFALLHSEGTSPRFALRSPILRKFWCNVTQLTGSCHPPACRWFSLPTQTWLPLCVALRSAKLND